MESHDKIIKLLEEIRDIERDKYLVLQKDVERAEAASRQALESAVIYRKQTRHDVLIMFALLTLIILMAIGFPFIRALITNEN